MDGKQSQLEIASVFMHKYKSLYTSVLTSDEQMNTINSSISERCYIIMKMFVVLQDKLCHIPKEK